MLVNWGIKTLINHHWTPSFLDSCYFFCHISKFSPLQDLDYTKNWWIHLYLLSPAWTKFNTNYHASYRWKDESTTSTLFNLLANFGNKNWLHSNTNCQESKTILESKHTANKKHMWFIIASFVYQNTIS